MIALVVLMSFFIYDDIELAIVKDVGDSEGIDSNAEHQERPTWRRTASGRIVFRNGQDENGRSRPTRMAGENQV